MTQLGWAIFPQVGELGISHLNKTEILFLKG